MLCTRLYKHVLYKQMIDITVADDLFLLSCFKKIDKIKLYESKLIRIQFKKKLDVEACMRYIKTKGDTRRLKGNYLGIRKTLSNRRRF